MPLGHAPPPDDIRRPVPLRVVGQKQQHIQLVVGQVPFFADRLHQAAVAFLRPKRRFKKSKLHMRASFGSFLNEVTIACTGAAVKKKFKNKLKSPCRWAGG